MRLLMITAALLMAACAGDQSAPAQELDQFPSALRGAHLSADGLGPIRIGADVRDVQALLGDDLRRADPNPLNPGCDEWVVLSGSAPNGAVTMLSFDNRIVSVGVVGGVGIQTIEGIGVGSTAEAVGAAYPNGISENDEYAARPAHQVFAWSDPSETVGLHFSIDENGRVRGMTGGGELRNIEGCAGA